MSNNASVDCFTCQPLEEYLNKAGTFSDSLSSALQAPMWSLFIALTGLWAVTTGIKLALGMTGSREIIKDLVFISISGILLGSQGPALISAAFNGALSIMSESAAVAFQVAGGEVNGGSYSGISALAASGEAAMTAVFQVAQAITSTSGWGDPIMPYVYAILLVLPYILLLIAYVAQAVTAIFRLLMVSILAPFLSLTFAFGSGRGMTFTGLKTALGAILVLFASTAALALSISGVTSIKVGTNLDGADLSDFASISNPEFLVILVMGWIGTALIAEASKIANSIAGTALDNAAAGMMTAGTTGAAALATGKARMAAGVLGARGTENLKEGHGSSSTERARALADRQQNINRRPPDGGSST